MTVAADGDRNGSAADLRNDGRLRRIRLSIEAGGPENLSSTPGNLFFHRIALGASHREFLDAENIKFHRGHNLENPGKFQGKVLDIHGTDAVAVHRRVRARTAKELLRCRDPMRRH